MSLDNLLAWSLQVGILVLVGAIASLLLRHPRARLYFWQEILLIILLLPAIEPWHKPAPIGVPAAIAFEPSRMATAIEQSNPSGFAFSREEWLLGFLALGALLRLLWLALGLLRLARIRRRAQAVQPPLSFATGIRWYLSDQVSGPVTFGWLRPSIVLPMRIQELPAGVQEAITNHELLHVQRRDWLFVMGEELIRSALWFHPAVWFALGQIQLAREQVVDREVVAATGNRAGYLDALMAVAAQKLQPDIALAPLFLKKRQLAVRVAAILKETSMSRFHLVGRIAGAVSVAVLGAVAAIWLFPLQTSAQVVPDDAGVTVDAGGKLLHRTPVKSPVGGNVFGDVIVEATLNAKGEVSDARVLSGPEELRKSALASILNWHYEAGSSPPVRIVIHFEQRSVVPPPPPPPPAAPGIGTGIGPGIGLGIGPFVPPAPPPPPPLSRAQLQNLLLKQINFDGSITEEFQQQIRNRLPIHEGEILPSLGVLRDALRQIDEHLVIVRWRAQTPLGAQTPAELQVQLGIQDDPPVSTASAGPPLVTDAVLIKKVPMSYPRLAKTARVQGDVVYLALVGADGRIQNLDFVSGNGMLATPETMDAVRQWVYDPYIVNGRPTSVQTMITVHFQLN